MGFSPQELQEFIYQLSRLQEFLSLMLGDEVEYLQDQTTDDRTHEESPVERNLFLLKEEILLPDTSNP